MRIQITITQKLWYDLDLQFCALHSEEAKACLFELGLDFIERFDEDSTQQGRTKSIYGIYDVIDKEKFFLSVIKHGIEFKEI
jgi:hypothetical protein